MPLLLELRLGICARKCVYLKMIKKATFSLGLLSNVGKMKSSNALVKEFLYCLESSSSYWVNHRM